MNRDRGWRIRYEPAPFDPWLGGERQAIEYRAIRSADAFRRDPEVARGAAMMERDSRTAGPQVVDVTGKVQSDVNVKSDSTVEVEITAAPGIEAR